VDGNYKASLGDVRHSRDTFGEGFCRIAGPGFEAGLKSANR